MAKQTVTITLAENMIKKLRARRTEIGIPVSAQIEKGVLLYFQSVGIHE